MQTITNTKTLTAAIKQLEGVKRAEGNLLKEHFQFTIDSLNPINIVKEKINHAFHSDGMATKLIGSGLGIATSMLTGTIIGGSGNNPIRKLLATAIHGKIISLSNSEEIKDKGISWLSNALQKIKIK